MNCKDTKLFLYEYINNALDLADKEEVENHLQSCSACQKEYEETKETIETLHHYDPPRLSDGFDDRLRMRIEALKEKSLEEKEKWWMKYLRPVPYKSLALATGIVIAVMGTFIVLKESRIDHKEIQSNDRGGKIEITLADAKNPIIIGVNDPEKAFDTLESLILSSKGKTLRKLYTHKGIKVAFTMNKDQEPLFFEKLLALGTLERPEEGFRDEGGNMVILLKRVSP